MALKLNSSPGFVTVVLLMLTRTHGDSVTQTEGQVVLSEDEFLTIHCNYSASGYLALFWYVQYPGEGPQLLFRVSKANDKGSSRGFEATYDRGTTSFHLQKASVQESDSAVYYCALVGSSGFKLIFGTGTRLSVDPNIQDPKPAVYQLRDPKSKNNTICLFTDFGSQANMPQSMSDGVFKSNGTVLDMKSMDSKSNGLIVWSKHNSLNCNADFAVNASYPSAEVPCDAKLIEKSFETDMNLNFRNLTVMGLRILLLKVAGFNLLMTLRLWSS
ncbi:T cell receptor alpha chain MC.7.G5-like [Meriones unguiculatus]|uniref:T cell receptor alpha chain MC.7.G5-like n=1 Tax=Meriones unguiculatus TaxID=10047 RepID=UPI00293EAFE6|nr:T cell receptor alpha chain MC.7.G5-like [Meriones unguiculatus]